MKDYKALQNGSDIRGVAIKVDGGKPVNLTEAAVFDLAYGFAEFLSQKLSRKYSDLSVAVGRDSRISGPDIQKNFESSLIGLGVKVYDCSMATTPAMFMSTVYDEINADGAVMITASHLPMERNGLKFFTKDGGLDKKDIAFIIERAENCGKAPDCKNCAGDLKQSKLFEEYDLVDLYSRKMRENICKWLGKNEADLPLKNLHIVVDGGNGASGFYVSKILEPLGADCSGSQFLEPDGTFPNHQPNPENKDAMESVCAAVKTANADLGIIFDTDGDRSSAVDENGKEIARNRIVALAALIASEGHPGTTIVTDSITSTQLSEFLTKELGLKHLRYMRGYRNVITKGEELNAAGIDCQLAIETSGHAAMKENYFLDDGAYLAAKIIVKACMLKQEGRAVSTLLSAMKEPAEAKEFRFALDCSDFASYAQTILDDLKSSVESGRMPGLSLEIPNYEGVRVNVDKLFGDGWFLIRKSLHDPVMPLNIESNENGGVEKIYMILEPFLKQYEHLCI